MKRHFLTIALALMSLTLFAANTTYLPISVYVGDLVEPFPEGAKALMESRLTQVLTKNGVAGMSYQGQFALTVAAVPIDKDILPGPPSKISEKLEVNLFIVDVYNKTIFASTSVTARGIGENENKAYVDAIKRMPVQNKDIAAFVEEGKQKIVGYYDAKAEQIIQKARALAMQKDYGQALNIVSLIPEECKYYNDALAAGVEIYQQYLDNECNINLAAARQAWAAEQNSKGAQRAGEYLANILPDAACYGDAMELYNEIKGKVLDDWKFEMKIYQDGVDLEKERIKSMRDIGVAWGENQPREIYHLDFLPHFRR
ncbi:MAG: hypothetical protein J5635_05700 [Paludibacteraceae bacterium]|nr:hypothetical protein [Paludibacteraceae bacterium]